MLVRFRNDDLMRETEVHNQVCALLLNTVANAVDFELFLKAFRYTHDHVVDKGTGEAVQSIGSLCRRSDV